MSENSAEKPDSVIWAMLSVADVLEAEGIRYALIGGLAAAQHGVIRATQDADFLLAVPALRLPPLLTALEQSGCSIDHARVIREWSTEYVTQFSFGDVPIDWLAPIIPLFQTVLDRAATREVLGHRLRIVDIEGAVVMKTLSFRPEDQRDMETMIAANPHVDWAFVKMSLAMVFDANDERLAWIEKQARG